jgi:hypothetical protein
MTDKTQEELTAFCGIWQHVSENYSGSTRDLFVTAIEVYEDEYGEITDATADEWWDVIMEAV